MRASREGRSYPLEHSASLSGGSRNPSGRTRAPATLAFTSAEPPTFTLTFYRVAQAKSSPKKNNSAPGQASTISVVNQNAPATRATLPEIFRGRTAGSQQATRPRPA
jgi:hypothetical protein